MKAAFIAVATSTLLAHTTLGPTRAEAGAPEPALRVSGPYVHENLDVYLVHGPDRSKSRTLLTLGQALEQKKVIVRETNQVSQLTIENVSSEEVYVQAGEIVKGGKQDRTLGVDLVLPPKSGPLDIQSFCVESGRWRARGQEASDRFSSSSANVASNQQRIANYRGSQSSVWEGVDKMQDKLGSKLGGDVRAPQSSSSLQLTLENDRVRRGVGGYEKAFATLLADHPDAVGYAFAINGQVYAADVYASSSLFRALWPKLIRANAVEAVAERDGKAHKPPALDVVRAFIEDVETGTQTVKPHKAGTTMTVRESSSRLVVETQETRSKAWIHRSYVKK
jgi:hypothetical protein